MNPQAHYYEMQRQETTWITLSNGVNHISISRTKAWITSDWPTVHCLMQKRGTRINTTGKKRHEINASWQNATGNSLVPQTSCITWRFIRGVLSVAFCPVAFSSVSFYPAFNRRSYCLLLINGLNCTHLSVFLRCISFTRLVTSLFATHPCSLQSRMRVHVRLVRCTCVQSSTFTRGIADVRAVYMYVVLDTCIRV